MLSSCSLTAAVKPAGAVAPPAQIWPHQLRYREGAQALAQDLFDALDDDLKPFVLLLALPTDDALPARCLEPEDCSLPAEAFSDAVARGRMRQLTTPWPFPDRADITAASIRRKHQGIGIRDAVQETLNTLDEHGHYQHFAGWPVEINGYFVTTVLRLVHKPLRAYPSLQPARYYTDGKPLAPSLLLAAMYRFNEEGVKTLSEPEPGASIFVRPRESEELLRAAGKTFLDTPAQALGLNPATTKLFATCNTISSLRYEGAEGVGKLLLARRGHPNIEEIFALTCPTELTDYRAVRKLLEMATPDVHLLADGENVYALGRQIGHYDAVREDLFVINFVTHYAWELQHAGHVLMRSHYGLPGLPRTRLNRTSFRKALKRTFPHRRAQS